MWAIPGRLCSRIGGHRWNSDWFALGRIVRSHSRIATAGIPRTNVLRDLFGALARTGSDYARANRGNILLSLGATQTKGFIGSGDPAPLLSSDAIHEAIPGPPKTVFATWIVASVFVTVLAYALLKRLGSLGLACGPQGKL